MRRTLFVAFGFVVLSATAGVALIADDVFDTTTFDVPDVNEGEIDRLAQEIRAKGNEQDRKEVTELLTKKVNEIKARYDAAAKEAESEMYLQQAIGTLKSALKNPETKAGKKAKAMLESITLSDPEPLRKEEAF